MNDHPVVPLSQIATLRFKLLLLLLLLNLWSMHLVFLKLHFLCVWYHVRCNRKHSNLLCCIYYIRHGKVSKCYIFVTKYFNLNAIKIKQLHIENYSSISGLYNAVGSLLPKQVSAVLLYLLYNCLCSKKHLNLVF